METSKPHPPIRLRRLRRQLTWIAIFYFLLGTISQKLLPGVDEIIPFFGWSLFSKVPAEISHYTILIHRHEGESFDPPLPLLQAPDFMLVGDRFIARKLLQNLGYARDDRRVRHFRRFRGLFEQEYLRGEVEYELVFERFEPLEKWRTGAGLERRSLGRFQRGEAE